MVYVFNELSLFQVDQYGKKNLTFNQYAKLPYKLEEIVDSPNLIQIEITFDQHIIYYHENAQVSVAFGKVGSYAGIITSVWAFFISMLSVKYRNQQVQMLRMYEHFKENPDSEGMESRHHTWKHYVSPSYIMSWCCQTKK